MLLGDNNNNMRQIMVSEECFKAILKAEITFREVRDQSTSFQHSNVLEYFINGLMYIWNDTSVPNCHNICRNIL